MDSRESPVKMLSESSLECVSLVTCLRNQELSLSAFHPASKGGGSLLRGSPLLGPSRPPPGRTCQPPIPHLPLSPLRPVLAEPTSAPGACQALLPKANRSVLGEATVDHLPLRCLLTCPNWTLPGASRLSNELEASTFTKHNVSGLRTPAPGLHISTRFTTRFLKGPREADSVPAPQASSQPSTKAAALEGSPVPSWPPARPAPILAPSLLAWGTPAHPQPLLLCPTDHPTTSSSDFSPPCCLSCALNPACHFLALTSI